jgi:hypothetical protein
VRDWFSCAAAAPMVQRTMATQIQALRLGHMMSPHQVSIDQNFSLASLYDLSLFAPHFYPIWLV